MLTCESIGEALSGYLDDELTQQESQRVELHLRECEKCRSLLNQMQTLQQAVGKTPAMSLDQQHWDRVHQDPIATATETAGWVLLAVCLLPPLIVGSVMFLADTGVSVLAKLIAIGSVSGLALLFYTVLRQRMLVSKTDKYRKVKI
ncbi:zf-HC2 domain-containing protein [Rubripirellula amarantea]|nr:zf-HC2 domain-containing protein [Rubripirellula amarantea]